MQRCISRGVNWRHGVAWIFACGLLAGLACGSDETGPAAPLAPAEVQVTSGDDQEAVAGETLPESISVTVVDRRGRPMEGITVEWTAHPDRDRVDPAQSITGPEGVAWTVWTLGPTPGEHTVHATVAGYGSVIVRANAAPAPLVFNQVYRLNLVTPGGSGQTVHPEYLGVTAPGPLAADYLAITEYPFGNAEFENPSVYTSLDRVHWRPPPDAVNPVVLPQAGFLSDPDLVFNPVTSELWLYYRQVDVLNDILLTKSPDGVHWSEPRLVTNALNHLLVSPTVVRRSETEWLMWAVNGQAGCAAPDTWIELRRSTDGEVWSPPQRVSLATPGLKPWHVDVQWIPSRAEYWALYNVKPPDSCSSPALYLATSVDGAMWKTYPSPVLARGEIPDFSEIVYRASFRYRADTDAITFFFSGAAFDGSRYTWRSSAQRRQRQAVFDAIARQPSTGLTARLIRQVPPLLDPP